ncbi:MAG: CPBP family intramembrane metalloprotease [Sedimentisphaerales bacterium]|nr:CPBP family intramembrane metalloprotease [Sedimentisphaerales bacterium]
MLQNVWLAGALYYIGTVIAVWMHRQPKEIKLSGWSWTGLGLAILAAGGIYGGILLLWPWAVKEELVLGEVLSKYGLSSSNLVFFIPLALVLNPIIEELLWRGLLDTGSARFSWLDLAFAGYHIPVLALAVKWPFVFDAAVALTMASWALRWAKHTFGGMAIPWLAHALADGVIVAALARILYAK